MLFNGVAITSTMIVGWVLFSRQIRLSNQWRATVTPLASIIGSGFLIVAPLLHSVMGKWALLGMILLSMLAYCLGGVIRFNIFNAEPYLDKFPKSGIAKIEVLGQWCLGAAYAISVAFYISLFASFLFDRLDIVNSDAIKIVTTFVLLAIMLLAWLRGAKGLEVIELYAVTIKLAIIVGVLFALFTFDLSSNTTWFQHEALNNFGPLQTLSILAGMLMVTQGFETARFMGGQYSTEVRVRAVNHSQGIATLIYIAFIALTCPLFNVYPIVELNETTISNTLGKAVWVLPFLLLIAATASQLSAALADTIGGGGLLKELIRARFSTHFYYMLIIGIAIALVWTSDVFEIINLASKGFALYYLSQTILASCLLIKRKNKMFDDWFKLSGSIILSGILVLVIVWSMPAPHG
jgi:hypothetical protein